MILANKIYTANKISRVKDNNKSIKKFTKLKTGNLLKNKKLSKFRKLFKLGKSKSEKLAKFKEPLKKKNSPNFGIKKT